MTSPGPKSTGSCLVRVWFVLACLGSCLVRVWFASGFVSGSCLVRVWCVSGACLIRVWFGSGSGLGSYLVRGRFIFAWMRFRSGFVFWGAHFLFDS